MSCIKINKPLVIYIFSSVIYDIPSDVYIVKLPLALGYITNLTKSILAKSHDDAKNPY